MTGSSDAGNFVQRCLQAGADPSKPQDSQGTRPLQLLCQLSVAGFRAWIEKTDTKIYVRLARLCEFV